MYGNIENAFKAANHELRALNWVLASGIHELHVPLFAVIDLCGYRLSAISLLPISKSTLVYGSADAGVTIYNSDPKAEELAKRLAHFLNLKPHVCGVASDKKLLYTCGDMEIHLGRDSRYYVLDAARLFPPTEPMGFAGNETLYNLFRPSFLKGFEKPLSSDAFSIFEARETRETSMGEIENATKYLLDVKLTQVLQYIVSVNAHDSIFLSSMLHLSGINLRYLGLARRMAVQLFKSSEDSDYTVLARRLLEEMAVRSMKCMFRRRLRGIMKTLDSGSDLNKHIREIAVDFIGEISDPESASKFWSIELKYVMCSKFIEALSVSESERTTGFDLREVLDDSRVLWLFREYLDIRLKNLFLECVKFLIYFLS